MKRLFLIILALAACVNAAPVLLIVGNSIAAGMQSDSITKYRGLGEYAVNMGIGGSGVDTLIDSISVWLTRYAPAAVLIETGTNNRPNCGQWFYNKLDTVWQKCHAYNANMPVIFSEVSPTRVDALLDGDVTNRCSSAQVKLDNAEIWRLCIARGYSIAPIYLRVLTPIQADTNDDIQKPLNVLYTTDGVHFNATGTPYQTTAMVNSFIPTISTSRFSFGTNTVRDPWSAWVRGTGVTITGDTTSGALTFAGAHDTAYSPVFHFYPYSNQITFKTTMTSGTVTKLYRTLPTDFSRISAAAWTALSNDTISTTNSFIQVALVSTGAAVMDSFVIYDTLQKYSAPEKIKYFGNKTGMIPIGFRDAYVYEPAITQNNSYGFDNIIQIRCRNGFHSIGLIGSNINNYLSAVDSVDSVKMVLFVQENGLSNDTSKLHIHRMTSRWGFYNGWCEYSPNSFSGPSWNNANVGGGVYPLIPWASGAISTSDYTGDDSIALPHALQVGDSIIVNITNLYQNGLTGGLSLTLNGYDYICFYSQRTDLNANAVRPYFAVYYHSPAASSGGNGDTVAYNANGGSGSLSDPSSPYNYNSTVTVLANTFTRTGYTFSKWNTQAGGGGTDYNPAGTFSISANTVLYAQWTINTYTMLYNSNGGSGTETDPSSPYNYNSTVTVLSNTLAKMGYNFVKWNTAAGGGGTDYAPSATFSIAANTTLYAQWTIKQYTVSVSASGPGIVAAVTSPQDSGALFAITADSGNGTSAPWDSFAHWTPSGGAVITSTTTRHTTMYLTANGTAQVLFGTRLAVIPSLSYPANGDSNISTNVTLKWHHYSSDSAYRVDIDTSPTFISPLHVQYVTTDTAQVVLDTIKNHVYYWRTQGFNNSGSSGWATSWSFKTVKLNNCGFNSASVFGFRLGSWALISRKR